MNNKITFLALLLVAIVVLLCFTGCKKDEKTESSSSTTERNIVSGDFDVQEILSGTAKVVTVEDYSEQREDEQQGETGNEMTKKVTVSMVDISKVYQYFFSNGKVVEADAAMIEQFIKENKDNPDFQSEYIISAEVTEENGTWKLTSEESLQEIYNEQAEALILQKMSEIGEIEIADMSIEQNGD